MVGDLIVRSSDYSVQTPVVDSGMFFNLDISMTLVETFPQSCLCLSFSRFTVMFCVHLF